MPQVRRHWTTADVRALIEQAPRAWPRYELIDGELLVTPSPGWRHGMAVTELAEILLGYLKRETVGLEFPTTSSLTWTRGSSSAGRKDETHRSCSGTR